jgi:hypothetical protein
MILFDGRNKVLSKDAIQKKQAYPLMEMEKEILEKVAITYHFSLEKLYWLFISLLRKLFYYYKYIPLFQRIHSCKHS